MSFEAVQRLVEARVVRNCCFVQSIPKLNRDLSKSRYLIRVVQIIVEGFQTRSFDAGWARYGGTWSVNDANARKLAKDLRPCT